MPKITQQQTWDGNTTKYQFSWIPDSHAINWTALRNYYTAVFQMLPVFPYFTFTSVPEFYVYQLKIRSVAIFFLYQMPNVFLFWRIHLFWKQKTSFYRGLKSSWIHQHYEKISVHYVKNFTITTQVLKTGNTEGTNCNLAGVYYNKKKKLAIFPLYPSSFLPH